MDMERYATEANNMRHAKAKAEGVAHFVERLRTGPGSLDQSDCIKQLDREFRALAAYLGYKVEAAE